MKLPLVMKTRLNPFNEKGLFRPITPEGDALRQAAVRSVGVTLLSGSFGLTIQIVAAVVLARLLTARDFGLVTMVTTFSLLLVNFGLNGITEAVVQRDTIDHQIASNLFWINVAGSLVLAFGFVGAGPLLQRLYKDPLIPGVAEGVAVTIFFTGLSVVHLSLLKRAMRFSAVSMNDIVSRLVSVLTSIALALAGFGYWSLVAGLVAQSVSVCVGSWAMCHWMPSLPRRRLGTGAMVTFAASTYARFSTNYFTNNLDNFLVGWRLGSIKLGFYKKAYDLFALPNYQLLSGLTIVAVSALSRLRSDLVQYRRYLLGAIGVAAFVGMGLGADLTLVGKDLIFLLLGPKWQESGRLFTLFGPGIGIMMLYSIHIWIHLSIGRADRLFRWGLIDLAVTTLFLVVGLHWGTDGIAIGWVAAYWVLAFPALWYAGRPIKLDISPVIATVWRYIVASLVALGISAWVLSVVPSSMEAQTTWLAAAVRVAVLTTGFAVLYLSAVVCLHWGVAPIKQFTSLVREMLSRERTEEFAAEAVPASAAASVARVADADRVQPLVSILIPAYNAEDAIADTLRSALAQTWQHKEIIVVDDGSTDKTLAIAREFEREGVLVVTQKNQGATFARNKAFALSHGDYIQWLDADDLLAPDKISSQMRSVRDGLSKKILLSSSWGLFMHRYRRARFIATPLWCDLSPKEWLRRKMELNLYMQTATWLVSRELTEAAGPWDTRLLGDDDGEYFCRVLLASEGVRFVPESKVYYRGPGIAFGGLSHVGRSDRRIEAHWLSMKLHIKYLLSLEESDRVRQACLTYLQTSLIYFYPEKAKIVSEAQQTAVQLGGELSPPTLSWKYSWIKLLFGWRAAKSGQQILLTVRWKLAKWWDKSISQIGTKSRFPSQDSLERDSGVVLSVQ